MCKDDKKSKNKLKPGRRGKKISEKTIKTAAKDDEAKRLTDGREAEILALKRMGLTVAEIAKKIGVSVPTLKRACRVNPNLQEVYACQAYRIEYVQTRLFIDFKLRKLSERGQLKFLEILLSSQLVSLRKKLLEIEAAMKLNGLLSPDDRLEIDGVTEADIDRVMKTLSWRGNRDGGNETLFEGKSDYVDHDEIVKKNNAIG